MNDKTYRVVVTREGNNWLADVPGLDGAHTYARTLPALRSEVCEVIALAEDLPEGAEAAIQLDLQIHTGDKDVDVAAARVRGLRAQLARQEKELSERTLAVVRDLRGQQMSVRDVAAIVGISAQRVSQIAADRQDARAS